MDYTAINTIGALRGSGWVDRSVKDELRDNLMQRMRAGAELFPGIVGFDQTVIPALERAILAGHDIIMLGERGQAKTRLIRRLVDLLDPQSPTIDGCEINDSPLRPVCAACLATVTSEGDLTPIRWVTPALNQSNQATILLNQPFMAERLILGRTRITETLSRPPAALA